MSFKEFHGDVLLLLLVEELQGHLLLLVRCLFAIEASLVLLSHGVELLALFGSAFLPLGTHVDTGVRRIGFAKELVGSLGRDRSILVLLALGISHIGSVGSSVNLALDEVETIEEFGEPVDLAAKVLVLRFLLFQFGLERLDDFARRVGCTLDVVTSGLEATKGTASGRHGKDREGRVADGKQ